MVIQKCCTAAISSGQKLFDIQRSVNASKAIITKILFVGDGLGFITQQSSTIWLHQSQFGGAVLGIYDTLNTIGIDDLGSLARSLSYFLWISIGYDCYRMSTSVFECLFSFLFTFKLSLKRKQNSRNSNDYA